MADEFDPQSLNTDSASGQITGISGADEQKWYIEASNNHKIEIYKLRAGSIGRFIGANEFASTNIAAISLASLFIILIAMVILGIWHTDIAVAVIDKIISVVLAIFGYLFGVSQRPKND